MHGEVGADAENQDLQVEAKEFGAREHDAGPVAGTRLMRDCGQTVLVPAPANAAEHAHGLQDFRVIEARLGEVVGLDGLFRGDPQGPFGQRFVGECKRQ